MIPKESVQQVVTNYFAAIRAMDAAAFAATFADDGVTHDPVGTPPHQGREALQQFFQGIAALFETVGLTEEHVFICANEAAVKWIGTGIAKNGRSVRFEGVDVLQINASGKIQTVRAYWDPAALMAQLQG